MEPKVKNWLDAAQWAPSGGNSQPWRVSSEILRDTVTFEIAIDHEYRLNASPMDVEGIPSAVAIGAFAFNLENAAAGDGYVLHQTGFAKVCSNWDGFVRLEFRPGICAPKFSVKDLRERKTERTPFERSPVPASLVDRVRAIHLREPKLKCVEFSSGSTVSKEELFSILAPLEKIRWQNDRLLRGLIDEIDFSRGILSRDREYRKTGIPIDQLGVSGLDQFMLRLVARFPQLGLLFKMGFEKIAVSKALKTFIRECDRIFFIQIAGEPEKTDFETCFRMGQIFQESWLAVNQSGVAFQPMGLPLIALSYWRESNRLGFNANQVRQIEEQTDLFNERFEIDMRRPTIAFRIGYPKHQSGRAERREIDVGPLQTLKPERDALARAVLRKFLAT